MKTGRLSHVFENKIRSRLARFGVWSGLAVAVVAGGFDAQAAAPADARPDRILIRPKANVAEVKLRSLYAVHGMRQHNHMPQNRVRVMTVPPALRDAVMRALKRSPDIEFAEPDYIARPCLAANDPYFANGSEWHLPKIQAPLAWDVTTGRTNIILAVVDSGVDVAHPDLAGRLLLGYDLANNDPDPSDDNGHGTAVSGTAAARGNNGVGVAGVAWNCLILPVKVTDATGSASYSDLANGIIFAADRGARVINISLGGPSSSSTLQSAIDYAWSKGVVIVASAGNAGNSQPNYPGACNHVVAVSATQQNDTRANWSSYGSFVSLAAPGVGIWTCNTNGAYAAWSGTSFSSPIVAGVAALVASANPALSNAQIVDVLKASADDLGSAGFDTSYGYGRVNANRAVASATGAPPPPDTTAPGIAVVSPASGSILKGTAGISVRASDNVGVTRTECYVDGVLVGSSSSATATFSWNSATVTDGAHVLQARAYDAAGNTGISADVSVTVQNAADSNAPVVTISSPADGSTVRGVISIAVRATDSSGVAWVDCYFDGRLLGSRSGASATFSLDTTQVSNGAHTLLAHASDTSGNIGVSTTVTFTVQNTADTTAPTVTITAPAGGATVRGRINIALRAADNVGVTLTECYLDNRLIGSRRGAASGFAFDTLQVMDGTHTLQARAYDAAGNVGVSPAVNIVVQNLASGIGPTVAITSPANGATVSSQQRIAVTASEPGRRVVEVDLYIDGWFAGYSRQTNPVFIWDTRRLASGMHTLQAVAWDDLRRAGISPVVTVQK
ncbi:MAG: S8 family serine peptidase [Verrucomicrobia bacterium]|nr:S8 family serine peptidase [Verrucomicrobiota bacterium]